jgi:signal transduction histidine kinase
MSAPETGADVGHAAAAAAGRDPPGQGRLRQLADEQAALRRVATLVARAAPADELFTAVAEEVGRLLAADYARLARYEPDDMLTVLATWTRDGQHFPRRQVSLEGENVSTFVLRTGRPARIDNFAGATGPLAEEARAYGVRCTIGTPVIVEGRIWGIMSAGAIREWAPPPDTEARLASFTDLLATAIANAQAEEQLRKLADTQSALRRLATLVARGEPPEAVFAAATREALQYFGSGGAGLIRYEPDGTATMLGYEGTTGPDVRVGERWEGYPSGGLTAVVRRTGRAARVDDYRDIPGGEFYLRNGLRSAVALPVHVNGQLWGAIAVASGEGPLPVGTEQRMTEFTDLVATAVANAQNRAALEGSRDELARLLAEQAALRRVATLVARGIDPGEIFVAVAEEMRRLLGAVGARIARYEPDGASFVFVGGAGDPPTNVPAGTRVKLRCYSVLATVRRTGRAAQVDEDAWSSVSDPFADALRKSGIRSMVGSPIIVEGRLWGVVNAWSTRGRFPSGTVGRMADFTELIATAVGNAESRAEVSASRARIVAAADETRRRIERDLHDGTQQRLVSLGLELRLAQSLVPAGMADLQTELGRIAAELGGVVEDLREIARGIHPAILSEGGLRQALKTLARRAAIAVELDAGAIGRPPEPIEVAAYYVVSEAVTNATRHGRASVVRVAVEERDDSLRLSIRDDGVGGADPARGSGLVGLKDRAEALGGSLEVSSPPGQGTLIEVRLPLRLQ